ncbi:MAG: hypothetical protein ABFC12_05960 [Methanobacterium sp.]
MKIDADLFRKSKAIIPDRTADYEDYLRRRIHAKDRAELLRMEIEELESKKKELMDEYDIETKIKENAPEIDQEIDNEIMACVNTAMKIINNEGCIGMDRLQELAEFREVSVAQVKAMMPGAAKDKIVRYHLQTKTGGRFDELC